MAKILYGVSGEGSGHSSRATEIIRHLQKKGHAVKVVSYGRGYDNLKRNFDTEKTFGLQFVYRNNKIDSIRTIYKNTLNLPQAQGSIKKILKLIDDFKPQIVFSDFEPLSCICANIKKLPLISIDNQHRLNNTQIDYPKKYKKEAAAAILVTNLMIFNSKACLVLTFDQKSKILNGKTFLFSPVLGQEILEKKTSEKDYVLVYLTSEYRGLIDILKQVRKNFVCYGFNVKKREDNIVFKKNSRSGFIDDLSKCEGVVANAGFTLISEALYLGKPYLALPVSGQFEQIFNAYSIDKLGYGKFWEDLNQEKIEAFLFNLDYYRKNLKKYPKADNTKIFKKIDELIKMWAK